MITVIKILLGSVLFVTVVSFADCGAGLFGGSRLPKQMPANVEIGYDRNAGMVRAYAHYVIKDNVLSVDEINFNEQTPRKWTVEISRADLEKLYQAFVANQFDLIKNDEAKGVTYDAGSETVRITAGTDSYNVSYGANSPLSGSAKTRYLAVAEAVRNLVAEYQTKAVETSANYVVLPYDRENYKWLFKNAKATTLEGDEIAQVERLLAKAVADYNKDETQARQIDLAQYKRQFVPVVNEKGEKEIWINCFAGDFENWQTQIIEVSDGGKSFFNLHVNLIQNNYSEFSVNGNG
jgi:hypothetical protein